ncbi:hypothetical protein EON65_27665 [archaeon]|nr:MAG: hypothetical protein EON65_27665 [archaeon]
MIKGVLSALKSTDTDTVASLALCLWKPQLVQPVSLYSSIILQGKLVCCTLLKDKQIKTRLSKHIHADLHMPLHSEPNASQTYRHAGDPSDVESSESLFSLSSVDSITSNDDASSQYQYKPNSNTPTKHKDGNAAKKCTGLESMHRMFSDINTAQSGEGVVIKRKRGRPPKTVQPSSTSRAKTQSKDFTFLSKQQGRESAPDRKRGRPLTAAPSLSASSTMKRDGVPVSALANSSVPLRASETSSSHKQSPNGSGRPVSHRQAALDANINLRLCRDEDDDNEDGMVVIDDSSLSTQHRKQSNLLSVSHSSSAVSSQDTSLVSSSTSQPTSAAATLQETNRQDSYLQFTKEPTKKKRGRPLGSGRPLVPLAFEFNDLESLGEDAGESSEIFWSLLIIRFFRAVAHIPCAYFGHKKDNRIRLETSLYHLVTTSSRDNTICEPTDEEFADAVMKYNINAYWLKQWLHV